MLLDVLDVFIQMNVPLFGPWTSSPVGAFFVEPAQRSSFAIMQFIYT
jgi:hypothetical protein